MHFIMAPGGWMVKAPGGAWTFYYICQQGIGTYYFFNMIFCIVHTIITIKFLWYEDIMLSKFIIHHI